MPLRALGLDLGRSGKTAFSCVEDPGGPFQLRQCLQFAISGISAPEVEKELVKWFEMLHPGVIVMEGNGPGGVAADYISLHCPFLPLMVVDTGLPAVDLPIWNEGVLAEREFANIRAEMYWLVKQLLKNKRLKFPSEDAELFAQLSSTPWELDKTKGERIKIPNKKGMKIHYYHSELEGDPGSRSPDKADALALSCFGYAMIANEMVADASHEQVTIISPEIDGFFSIGETDLFEEIQ